MPEQITTIAVAFPEHEADRIALRERLGKPLPARYALAVVRPCGACGLALNVGPRVASMLTDHAVRLRCPVCAAREVATMAVLPEIVNLRNPGSRFED